MAAWVMAIAAVTQGAGPAARDRDLDFAAYLYGKGAYFQAAGEYHRWLFAHPDAPGDRARLGLGMCYLRGGRDDDARAALAAVAPAAAEAPRARHALAVALIRLGRPADATTVLARAAGPIPREHRLPAALAAGRRGDWAAAATLLAGSSRPGLAASAREAAAFRPPSPWVAGALAIVPGAGHAYAGRPDEVPASFAQPVTFGLAAWYYVARGEAWLAGLTGAAAATFWAGNVFGAIDAARRAEGDAWERAARPLMRAVDESLPGVD